MRQLSGLSHYTLPITHTSWPGSGSWRRWWLLGAAPSLIRKGNAEGVGGNWEEDTEREEDVRERNDGTAI